MRFDDLDKNAKILRRSCKVLSMIYFCLLLTATTAAGVSMMFYACLKRQGYLITFMHVLWNIIRFFIFSFFLYGTAYGIFFLILRDLIFCINLIFLENVNNHFLNNCFSLTKTNYLDESIKNSLINFLNTSKTDNHVKTQYYDKICNKMLDTCEQLAYKVGNGTFGSFDCGFLKSDLHHLFKTLNDASTESRILSALSLCSSFFGAIAVYFYLLVIHHYNNELFYDSGKSIFTGFDGFGKGFKKRDHSQDPAYKKRKLRAEIELTSKNEDENIED